MEGADSSCSDLRYAADPMPLSCVCRNHDGSLAPKEAAMSCRDGVSSPFSPPTGPGLSRESREGPREPDNGRERTDPVPREEGLCCHDRVPLRDRAVALLGGKEGDSGFSTGGRGSDLSCPDSEVDSGLLEFERVGLCSGLESVWPRDRGVKETGGSIDRSRVEALVSEERVAAGPVLTGEIDRARSGTQLIPN